MTIKRIPPICLENFCSYVRRREGRRFCFFDDINQGAVDALDFINVPGCLRDRDIDPYEDHAHDPTDP